MSQAKSRQFLRLCTAPLDVTPALQENLFLRKKTVALTSATLTVDGKFEYMAKQLGLPGAPEPSHAEEPPITDMAARLMTVHLDTPFDYASNCLVGIPTDLPTPADPAFDKSITEPISRTLAISQGRAFVLFTSYRALMNVLNNCRAFLERHGLRALRQGEVPRHKLLQLFRDTDRGVLFATSSFWEGVDVQGRALECLILTRLPFSVPSTPIIEARAERIESMGGSAFYQLTVPHAVIKFKQGFGRLIRSRSDRGIVLILDNRVLNKPYGKIFLRSLPPARRIAAPFADVAKEFQQFFE
jgi:ATP-dependent DNA helicase DinG